MKETYRTVCKLGCRELARGFSILALLVWRSVLSHACLATSLSFSKQVTIFTEQQAKAVSLNDGGGSRALVP